MTFLRYLARNVSILNILLAAVVVAILTYALFPLFSVKAAHKPHPGKAQQPIAVAATQPLQVPSPSDYTVVTENNLFHPERKIPPEKKEEKELPKPELILYGTMVTADLSIAYVDDKNAPYTTPGRGKRQRTLKKGDVISGFVLKEIETNRITLVRNGEVITFNLETEKEREGAGRAMTSAARTGTTAPVAASPVTPLRKTPPPTGATNGGTPRQLPPLRIPVRQ